MLNKRRLTLLGLIVIVASLIASVPAFAATNGQVVSYGRDGGGYPLITFSVTGTTDDSGTGWDFMMGICYLPDGTIADTDELWVEQGQTDVVIFYCDNVFVTYNQLQTEPIHFEVRDLTSYVPENTEASFPAIFAAPFVVAFTSTGYQGPTIPATYELHTITCDTPVYDSANGNVVGSDKITAGQTWFVAPTASEGWRAVFVSGAHVGYIPNSCVGALAQ